MPKQVMFECPHCARPVHFEDGREEAVCPSCDAHFKLNLYETRNTKSTTLVATIAIILLLGLIATTSLFRHAKERFAETNDPHVTRGLVFE